MTATTIRRWDIGTPSQPDIIEMPVLDQHIDALAGSLDGVIVLYINHAISDSLMVARGLHRCGARLISILVPYHGGTGPTQQALRNGFTMLGTCLHPEPTHPLGFAGMMRATVRTAILQAGHLAHATGLPWMIVEDGGYAFPLLHDDPDLRPLLRRCLGAVEHTTRGRWNYEYAEFDGVPRTARTLARPAVTISGSALKTRHEGGFVAQALLDECGRLLRRDHQFLRHRHVTVIGYGRVGRALADQIAAVGARVSVVDPAPAAPLPAGIRHVTLEQALTGGSFLVFGATGTSSFPPSALTAFLRQGTGRTLYLASASSKAVEFTAVIAALERAAIDPASAAALAGPAATLTVEVDPGLGTRYLIRGPHGPTTQVVLLGNGYPVIFYPPDTHGAPNRAMDPVMTQLFLAAAGLPAAAGQLTPRVHDLADLHRLPTLPHAWRSLLDEAGLLRQWCAANGLDWPQYQHAVGLADTIPTRHAAPS